VAADHQLLPIRRDEVSAFWTAAGHWPGAMTAYGVRSFFPMISRALWVIRMIVFHIRTQTPGMRNN